MPDTKAIGQSDALCERKSECVCVYVCVCVCVIARVRARGCVCVCVCVFAGGSGEESLSSQPSSALCRSQGPASLDPKPDST